MTAGSSGQGVTNCHRIRRCSATGWFWAGAVREKPEAALNG